MELGIFNQSLYCKDHGNQGPDNQGSAVTKCTNYYCSSLALILSNDGNSHVFSKSFKIPLSCSSLQLSSGSLNIEAITNYDFPQNSDHVIDGAKQGSAKQTYCMYTKRIC